MRPFVALVTLLLTLTVATITTSCLVDIDFGNGTFRCEKDGICPAGQVCLSDGSCGLPGQDAGNDADGDGGTPAPSVAQHLIGNQLFLTFEDADIYAVFRDRSGQRADARHNFVNAGQVAGRYGLAVNPSVLAVTVPYSPRLLPSAQGITIEAWVNNQGGGLPAIYGDPVGIVGNGLPVSTQVALYMGDDGGGVLRFVVMDGCAGEVRGAAVPFVLGGENHVAVTWDRSIVRFYKEGLLVGTPQPLVAALCDLGRDFEVGETSDGLRELSGYLDELKVSDYAKTAEQIAESMAFDSIAMPSDCGNSVLDLGEDCDNSSSCCAMTCRFAAAGSSCGSGECDEAGLCVVAPGRSNGDIVVLYEFDAGGPGAIADVSGVAPALDLAFTPQPGVTFDGSAMLVSADLIEIATSGPATKVIDRVSATGAVTVEAWVQPANRTQLGPARIVSISRDTLIRNITLAQTATEFSARVRAGGSSLNGIPELHTDRGLVSTANPTHLVFSRDPLGNRRLWVNGVLAEQSRVEGTLTWDESFVLRLAHEGPELDGDPVRRPFQGTYHLIAIYDAAFSEERVAGHFLAGPQ